MLLSTAAMKAIVLTGYGGIDKLELRDVEEPAPAPGQLKVRVSATSINPIDLKIRRGDMRTMVPLQLPTVLGRDVSGEVVARGMGVSGFELGDRVMGLVNNAYAEFVVASTEAFARLPASLELVRAAAIPLVGLTGSQLIAEGTQVSPGERVLITGATGSVGRAAVFAARERRAHVIAGVRARQREHAERLGVDEVVALDDARDLARLELVDAVADTVGADVVATLLDKIKPGGVLATVLGPPPGARERGLRVAAVLAHSDALRLLELGRAVVDGKLVIPIDHRFPLEQAREAHKTVEAGGVGKVLLTL